MAKMSTSAIRAAMVFLLVKDPARMRRALAQVYPVSTSVNPRVGSARPLLDRCAPPLDGCFRLTQRCFRSAPARRLAGTAEAAPAPGKSGRHFDYPHGLSAGRLRDRASAMPEHDESHQYLF
jgi:hypothetical protein